MITMPLAHHIQGGGWGYSSGANPWGPNSRTEMQTGATYTFETSLDGDYKVYLYWTYWASRCTNSRIEIYNGSALLDTIVVNQKGNASQWNQLGTESYLFSGTARVVVRSDSYSCSTCADAVKFEYLGAPNTAPTATGVSITGNAEVGQVLTGNYTYNDADGDLEGTSTFRWLRNGAEIGGATLQTYTLAGADEGAMIIFEVTPVAQTGTSPGTAVQSAAVGPVGAANTAPTATGVSITGNAEVGQVLTGNYTYNDADGDLEGTSTFRWLRNGAEIGGATLQTYTLAGADEGAMIIFEVTPVAQTGTSPGTAVQSAAVGPVGAANTAPTATGVSITGNAEVGQILTGNYTYNDADGDLEGTSTFRWLRNGAEIGGATLQTYTLAGADEGAMIIFEVTPVASPGYLPEQRNRVLRWALLERQIRCPRLRVCPSRVVPRWVRF